MLVQISRWLWIVSCFAFILSLFWLGDEFLALAQGYRIAIGLAMAASIAGGGWYFTRHIGDD